MPLTLWVGKLIQPPSGGCVLKRAWQEYFGIAYQPAAFGRLCVETYFQKSLTSIMKNPAAFGRLCVETELPDVPDSPFGTSCLRAAVC